MVPWTTAGKYSLLWVVHYIHFHCWETAITSSPTTSAIKFYHSYSHLPCFSLPLPIESNTSLCAMKQISTALTINLSHDLHTSRFRQKKAIKVRDTALLLAAPPSSLKFSLGWILGSAKTFPPLPPSCIHTKVFVLRVCITDCKISESTKLTKTSKLAHYRSF